MFYGSIQAQEEAEFEVASEAESDRAFAVADAPADQAWVLSDRDVWYKNPAYRGPAQPHPEDYCGGCFSYDCSGECQHDEASADYDEEAEIAALEDTDQNDCPF